MSEHGAAPLRAAHADAAAQRLGWPRLHLRRIDSTNLRAQQLAAAGAPHGTLVTAAEQVAGRGRQGRAWSSPPGTSLSMSLLLREPVPLLSLVAGVAVAETIDAVRGLRVTEPALIKWPNDVLVGGRKLAGVLVEGRPQDRWAVLGIGVNVAVSPDALPEEIRHRAGTLDLPPAAIETTLASLLRVLERWCAQPTTAMLEAIRRRDALLGQPISWSGGSGTGAGIDAGGRLRVGLPDGGETALDAGEVHLEPVSNPSRERY